MTTNQTIDGVPRELLERIAESGGYVPRRAELRALLDAEKDEYIPDGILRAVEHGAQVDAIGILKQAAQVNGEPVALPAKKYPKDWNKGTLRNCNMEYMEGYNDAIDDVGKLGPLYAEQPAPVAVVLPERREIGANYPYLSDLDIEWNACLDEVTRLNTK